MRKIRFQHLFTFFICCCFLAACVETPGDSGLNLSPCSADFDQTALFENVANNIILPAYADLQTAVNEMQDKTDAFLNNPDENSLTNLQTAFSTAYMVWQSAAPFEFGPAENVFLRNSLNNFPLNVEALEANIAAGTYNFDRPDNYDKGFPALDYLLFGVETDLGMVVKQFKDESDADAYRQYLADVVADIKERVDMTYATWTESYKATFMGNTGTAAGTSLSLIINALNEHYEGIKRDKIGLPTGILTIGIPNPTKVEAYYSAQSIALAQQAVLASQQLFMGKDGIGLDDYLVAAKAMKGDTELVDVIKEQYRLGLEALSAIAEKPLSETVENNQDLAETAYAELTKQIVNIKTDMPSVLCVAITYIDNPSDSD